MREAVSRRDIGRRATAIVVVLAVEAGIAATTTSGVAAAVVAVVAVLGAAAAVAEPTLVAALSLPATFLTLRLSAGSLDLSYADAALVASLVACGLLAPWRDLAFRPVVQATCAYLALLAVTVLLRPSQRAFIEWGHRLVLVLGSAAVGAAIARKGRAHVALRAFVLAGVVVGLESVHYTLTHGMKPAYPFTFNKNAAGMLLTCALIVVFTAGPTLRWPRPVVRLVALPLLAGSLACQSRMAVAALVLVLLLSGIHQGRSGGLLGFLGVGASGAMIWATRKSFAESGENAKFNSLNTRLDTFARALELWRSNRLLGAGLRFWRDPFLGAGEPHNLVIAGLGESGVVGLLAVVVLNAVVIVALVRRRDTMSRLAVYVLIAQIMDGLGDIYWRAGTGTLPWLVVGLALGTPMATSIPVRRADRVVGTPEPALV